MCIGFNALDQMGQADGSRWRPNLPLVAEKDEGFPWCRGPLEFGELGSPSIQWAPPCSHILRARNVCKTVLWGPSLVRG